MKIRIKNVKVVDPNSPFNGKVVTIETENGFIKSIGSETSTLVDKSFEHENMHISPSWVDSGVAYRDPGTEWHESLDSLFATAIEGGIGHVIGFPNTTPVIQSKAALTYFKAFSEKKPVHFHNLGALTKDCKGEDFTEWQDLHSHGVLGFSDGEQSIQNADILLKALQYLQPLGSIVVQKPLDSFLGMYGQMHEGIASTKLGLKGIPNAAEEIIIQRDLNLLAYSGIKSEKSILHFSSISTAGSVELIRNAKKIGLPISCDVSAYQLLFTDEDLVDFESNLKVLPPYRSQKDIDALLLGLKDGTVDCIHSGHSPWDSEHKELEFDLAEFGSIGMQTMFSVLNEKLKLDEIILKIAINPRKIYKLEAIKIDIGQKVDFTIFDPALTYTYSESSNVSNSKNSPIFGRKLKGKALGIIQGNVISK
jgi:dihydroorotase